MTSIYRTAVRAGRLRRALLPVAVGFMVTPWSTTAFAQNGASREVVAPPPSPYAYAHVADLAQAAPTIAMGKIRSVVAVADERATGRLAGTRRYYLEVQVSALIRGERGLSPRVALLLDLAEPGSQARARALKGRQFAFFGRAAAGGEQIQLLNSEALLPWSAGLDGQLRSIVAELVAPDAPPAVTAIVNAFHVRGTVAGESETQIFLDTANGDPVSLSIIRRPGQQPRFGTALGEIIDEAASVPPRDTLLWYRLACKLPPALPAAAISRLTRRDADAAQADYSAFLAALGRCDEHAMAAPGR